MDGYMIVRRTKLESLDDYYVDLSKRKSRGVFFYRINGYNRQIHEFICHYYEAARQCGVIIEGRLQNPTNDNFSYYAEIMGTQFELNQEFICVSLKKWLPRMNPFQRNIVATSIFHTLTGLKNEGKTDSILKNIYIKFMCWLYYKFERIVNHLGEEKLPKILYEGTISVHELLLMSVLSEAGCDVLLLQYQGDAEYQKLDPSSARSDNLQISNLQPFPAAFSLQQVRKELQVAVSRQQISKEQLKLVRCTNTWGADEIFENIKKTPSARGTKESCFYNCFVKISGVQDRQTYENDLYQLQLQLKNEKRKIVFANQKIDPPTPEEISAISRRTYQNFNQLAVDLSRNIDYASNADLQILMKQAFMDVLQEKAKSEDSLNRLTNSAVYLLCWLRRYQYKLFGNWKFPEISCFFYMGGCQNSNEALFCKLLAKLPADVVVFAPNLGRGCCLTDGELYEIKNEFSMEVASYPEDGPELWMGTVAYHAERELDTLLYQDTGIFRDQQYAKANVLPLHTAYEEISILWDNEVKYRPNFSTADGIVNIPVLFAKISGVKDGNVSEYWGGIKKLVTKDTIVIQKVPNLTSSDSNPMKPYAVEFLKNGRLQKQKIMQHKVYQYGFLRESAQEYLLDKLQQLIQQKIISGTMENGTEYTIISIALNIDKKILRLIQGFDFTKKNPKLIYIITGETVLSLEDTIFATYLSQIGFDVLFFVPTGYQSVEKFFNGNYLEEHQIGTYLYDLQIPDLNDNGSSTSPRFNWREFLFGRG